MFSEDIQADLDWLIETYFSSPDRRLEFQKGDVLFHQGEANHRLFYVLSGVLSGIVEHKSGKHYELFRAGPGMFAGLHSFFAKNSIAASTVQAAEDSVVSYITHAQAPVESEQGATLVEQFFPVAVEALVERQHREQIQGLIREQALKKLVETEKLASLGQMAAGLAHELNNAISVLGRTTDFLSEAWEKTLVDLCGRYLPYFQHGNTSGRRHTKVDVRAFARQLRKERPLDEGTAKQLAELVLEMGALAVEPAKITTEEIAMAYHYFDIGAALYDARIASSHAAHVVRSVHSLAEKPTVREEGLDLNKTIEESIALLRRPLREIAVIQDLDALPPVFANHGELVQVWTNLIKNAQESVVHSGSERPEIRITSRSDGNAIRVRIEDNGPGIPKALLGRIFQPDVSTKTEGLSFGLGLGLTIVQRIIQSYNGKIDVSSQPGATQFSVSLPIGGS